MREKDPVSSPEPAPACPHPTLFPGSWPHLAQGGPLLLTLGAEALAGIRVSEEHPHCAESVQQPQADTGGIPKPYRPVLMPVGTASLSYQRSAS